MYALMVFTCSYSNTDGLTESKYVNVKTIVYLLYFFCRIRSK